MKFSTNIATLLIVAVIAYTAQARDLLQREICSAADPNSPTVPPGALLYLSVRANGTTTFQCIGGKPTEVGEETQLTSQDGWTGRSFINKDGFLQLDVQIFDNDTSTFARNSVVLNKDVVMAPNGNDLPFARWNVLSTDGDSPPRGLPKQTYVSREDIDGGAMPKCDPGSTSTSTVPFAATYNIYTCDKDYTAPSIAPTVIISKPSMAPLAPLPPQAAVLPPWAPIAAPKVVPLPAPLAVTVPRPAPGVAPAARPAVVPATVLPVVIAPAPAPSSAMQGSSMTVLVVAAVVAGMLVIV